jgi:hypothetical protein
MREIRRQGRLHGSNPAQSSFGIWRPPNRSPMHDWALQPADYHLYRGKEEIAAWNDQGHPRHGSLSGTKLPKKAFDALMQKYPGCCGITGRILEHLQDWTLRRMLLIEGTENPSTLTLQ